MRALVLAAAAVLACGCRHDAPPRSHLLPFHGIVMFDGHYYIREQVVMDQGVALSMVHDPDCEAEDRRDPKAPERRREAVGG